MIETQRVLAEFLAMRKRSDDGASATVEVDEPLLDGLLDSLGILSLAVFIGERFGVQVQDTDLIPENFATIKAIAEYIDHRRGS